MPMEFADSDSKPRARAERNDTSQIDRKLSSKGITLVPQPSDDVKDPLVCSRSLC